MTEHPTLSATPTPLMSTGSGTPLRDRLGAEPFALVFSGQGFNWLATLRDTAATGVGESINQQVTAARERLTPVAEELAGLRPFGFDPVAWARGTQGALDPNNAAVSVPGIFTAQLAVWETLSRQGLDLASATITLGHSQGVLGEYLAAGELSPAELLAIAELVGAAITRTGRATGLLARGDRAPMISLSGVPRELIDAAIAHTCADLPEDLRPVVRLRNGERAFVLVGRPEDNEQVITWLHAAVAKDAAEVAEHRRGGAALAMNVNPLPVQAAFHHPAMSVAVDQVERWAISCGLDATRARAIATDILVAEVDWPAKVLAAVEAGARWFFELGPEAGVSPLTEAIIAGRGAGSLVVTTVQGQAELFDAGRAPALPASWQRFAPYLEASSHAAAGQDGVRVVSRFSEVTGYPPILLAGMTPTTVDPGIVAAAANAGYWAELAGGGQVTTDLLGHNLDRLGELLNPGINAQFNAMYLSPNQWRAQIEGQRMVPRARANGAPIDGVVCSAGVPPKEEAVSLIQDLRASGIPWVAFKPGTIKHIAAVLAIADEVPHTPVIMQIEGGKAGGHHSWEDLDELLLATYADIRSRDNVLLTVGGGIGTPERAADYLTGAWSVSYGRPLMPVDGILVGTAAMATKESTASESVKQALVATRGIDGWVPAGGAAEGMASGRSQLGADIHEIDNSFARAGRLLDEVAGDAAAVEKRRTEIIEAINKTCKPFFGELAEMSYEQWLRRYIELSGPRDGQWLAETWFDRFSAMLDRAQARLTSTDHGEFEPALTAEEDLDPEALIDALVAAYPHATTDLLYPSDIAWFSALLAQRGKPANFVAVIDADVRRNWRADTLWQAHDDRYDADEVSIIPGTAAVAGITQANEPVAELLGRFQSAIAQAIRAAGTPQRTDERTIIDHILAATDTYWAGRHSVSLLERLGDLGAWELAADHRSANHAPSGAQLHTEDEEHAILSVPLAGSTAVGTTASLNIRITVPLHAPAGAAPQVTRADAEAAMTELIEIAAGGTLAPITERTATWSTTLTGARLTDYHNVTAGYLPTEIDAPRVAGDVLVGLAWPAIFAAVGAATVPGDDAARVVEGVLSLVHLEHHLRLHRELPTPAQLGPNDSLPVEVSAVADRVTDTDIGRLVVVRATVRVNGEESATLTERFAIRGRSGAAAADTVSTMTSLLPTVTEAPASLRAYATVTAPPSMWPFAVVSGDRNPIHVSDTAARLAGLPEGVIVHGMWTSALAQLIAAGGFADEASGVTTRPVELREFTATMLAPILPGQEITFSVMRTGRDSRPGFGEVRTVTAEVDGTVVLTAVAVVAEPLTFYGFPGQGIQHPGMGMEARANSRAARSIWDRADAHTRSRLGFSILEIVAKNPAEVVVAGERFSHPDGVLFLTQFTQVAMATLGVAQIAEMKEAGVYDARAYFAGHSVGEYNALAAYAEVLSLEAVLEIVYRRGLTMDRLVERDAEGRSDYGLAALRPNKMGMGADEVFDHVARLSQESGEFLEIVNYNILGRQYAVAGTRRGLAALGRDAETRAPGQRAFIPIPGIDVPFHSTRLRDGVPAFRAHLDSLIPQELNLEVLLGHYIPNLVARPFELSYEFVAAIAEVVDSAAINEILADFDNFAANPVALGRTLLIELLAWQFASPVRWIETQDLLLRARRSGGLGVERFVEVGVGQSPTLANMLGQTLSIPDYAHADLEVLNVERDRATVFATDAYALALPEPVVEAAELAEPSAPAEAPVAAAAAPAPAAPAVGGERPADLEFTAGDATEMLVAVWTKVRPDQIGTTDSIEALVEGVSSRRNQLLLDLGTEFGLGAIDGAADAEIADLKVTVSKLAKGYHAFGPVLGEAVSDALRRITGPTGKKPGYVAERVTGTWQLGPGWADQVSAQLVMGAREGASLRGGELATLSPVAPSNAAELDALIDAAVAAVATHHGLSVGLPQAAAAGGVVDSAALGEFAAQVTGEAGVLARTARTILHQLGLDEAAATIPAENGEGAEGAALAELVARELGSDWPRQVAPRFDAQRAVLLDDRWASAREDLSRVAAGLLEESEVDVTGAGEAVARQAEYFGLAALAAQARETTPLELAEDIAVVTGASPRSIAAAVVEKLLHRGATVIATTSNLDHDRLEFYKELYAGAARGTAALWVVPANLSSYADLDALVEWIGSEQTATVGGAKKVLKPAQVPTLVFPFAAPRVQGTLADAGPAAEAQLRLLLWSVERLIAGLATLGADTHVGERLHVVLPGSPNRGRFGGDGAYGEAKAALDAVVTRWHAEEVWGSRTSLVHALIGWVRGTGLMGGNDPMVEAVEAAGVRTYAPVEIAELLVEQVAEPVRERAALSPVTCDFTGGLGEVDLDLPALAREAAAQAGAVADAAETRLLAALPNPYRPLAETTPEFAGVTQRLEDMVVIVGAGELGPYGSARTRFEAELTGDLGAAGVMELAWSMGLISWDDESATPGWVDATGAELAEEDIYARFHDEVLGRVGVRRYHDDFDIVDNLAPELTTIYLEDDLSFTVADQETARTFVDSEPETTTARPDGDSGEWIVTRKAGSAIRVPRRMAMSRFVGGQIPEGFDPSVYGIPADMQDNLDRVALWNLVCTVDAFLSSGFSPAELLRFVHPARVSSSQGTGMGGMESLRGIYVDRILAEPRANDVLQEALPNVIAAHVMQDYVGGYGQMVHPVAACATAAVSVEEGTDKIRLGKSDFVVAGGFDDLSTEGITGFGNMAATADSAEMAAKGIEPRYFSRANDRRRGGFIESEGGGTVLLARGTLAAELGLPVLGVVGFAESFADGAHTSIPAPGLGALGAARGGASSRLARELVALGVSADEIAVISKHDTSTNANDPNESDLHERIAAELGRTPGNPLYVVSQKSLTGHAKGGAAAFQLIGLTQVLRTGQLPPNRALDCVDPVLRRHGHLVWLRDRLQLDAPKAGLVTSLGFGHVSALVALVHPAAFAAALAAEQGETALLDWRAQARARETEGLAHVVSGQFGAALYERPQDRNLGGTGDSVKEREAAVLLDDSARLIDGVLTPTNREF